MDTLLARSATSSTTQEQRGALLLGTFLLAKALFLFWYIASGSLSLAPDEAQYWTWSRHLDLGYYSKPPGIAWQIALGTWIWGHNELGVRFVSLVLGFVQPWLLVALARGCGLRPLNALWAGWIWAISPIGLIGSIMAITDVGMIFFWTIASLPWMRALFSEERRCRWELVGLAIAVGALFKWPIYSLWLLILLLWPLAPLSKEGLVRGLVLSLLGLLPSLAWNSQHDWATYRHVFQTLAGGHGGELGTTALFQGNLLEFLAAQLLLLTPLFFGLLVGGWRLLWRSSGQPLSPPERVLLLSSLLPLGLTALLACFQKMQGNWCDFALVQGVVAVSWYGQERQPRQGLAVGGSLLALGMAALLLLLPPLQQKGALSLPYIPFKHQLGWDKMAEPLERAGYDPERHFLFAARYQTTSLLAFYAPGQRDSYFFNLFGLRYNQFCYWPTMADKELGKEGFFALTEQPRATPERLEELRQRLLPHFEQVDYVGETALLKRGQTAATTLHLFHARGYLGTEPPVSTPHF